MSWFFGSKCVASTPWFCSACKTAAPLSKETLRSLLLPPYTTATFPNSLASFTLLGATFNEVFWLDWLFSTPLLSAWAAAARAASGLVIAVFAPTLILVSIFLLSLLLSMLFSFSWLLFSWL